MSDELTELTEKGIAVVGGPDLTTGEALPEPIEPDLELFPWLADLDG